MRFLADAGISPKTVEFLNKLGHEAVHVRTLGLQEPSPSIGVWQSSWRNVSQNSNLVRWCWSKTPDIA